MLAFVVAITVSVLALFVALCLYGGAARAHAALLETCEHAELVRYWFKAHRFLMVCKACGKAMAGRDVRHPYPRRAA